MRGSVCSSFEGTEKKLELVVDPALASLRSFTDDYWTAVAHRAGADILSKLSNACCDAYLLSESSLFVFDHRMVMMTCGQTTLHDAALMLLDRIAADRVCRLIYKRKHEVFPRDQPTSFFDDVRALSARLPGRAYQFGNQDEHHLFLFHMDRNPTSEARGTTVEVLMHGLGEQVRRDFCITHRPTTAEVRRVTAVDRVVADFDVDDHLFQPNGYSLNAIRGDEYYAVHVTPEQGCSYASFETNRRLDQGLEPLLGRLLGIFRPRTWDLILFDDRVEERIEVPGYRLKCQVAQAPDRGLGTRFLNFYRPQRAVARAVELQVQ
jgi:S-adenosylmethionine decarboxylase